MSEFKNYKRTAIAEMRDVTNVDIEVFAKTGIIPTNDNVSFSHNMAKTVSISDVDRENGSPKIGDKIARNPKDHNDQWLVAAQYFQDNFEQEFIPEVKNGKKTHLHNLIDLRNEEGTFGQAIQAAKSGKKVARKGWNGQGMFVYYVPAASYPAMTEIGKEISRLRSDLEGKVQYREYLALKTAQGDVATWSPSGSDSLAEDWMIID